MKIQYLFKNEKPAFFIASALIAFGSAEVVTGIRHEFFGLVTAENTITTLIGSSLGLCYLFAGLLLLVYTKKALRISTALLVIDVIGRFVMMASGMYPMDSPMQILGMAGGTAIAIAFAIFTFSKYCKFVE
ncbi:MAG: hypothetical protein FWG30_05950 [Eubacteriaceae bacterium]|jgi:uncharacterized membrane protein|nr:hypothetical protein [Eubacteriaceae bacterium]